MTTINTNTSALITQLAMKRNERDATKAMEQLATGKRINRASDDAAGSAVVVKMNGIIKGLDQVTRNANDAIAMTETADGALDGITNILQRMRELAVQAASGTATNRDLSDVEFQSLKVELGRIAENTELNDIKLLDGSSAQGDGFQFQVGTRRGQTITIRIPDFSTAGQMAPVANSNILTSDAASSAISEIDAAIDNVLVARADVGALVSRLRNTLNNLSTTTQNAQASRSEILDADYAHATTELARTQVIQEAATAILAQANMTQQQVLKLLQ
jgi:flagellin